jgi:hypothetical protein
VPCTPSFHRTRMAIPGLGPNQSPSVVPLYAQIHANAWQVDDMVSEDSNCTACSRIKTGRILNEAAMTCRVPQA